MPTASASPTEFPPPLALNPDSIGVLTGTDRDQRIIDLCDGAIDHLREARSIEDVFGIRNAAEAFSVFTRKWKAAVEAQASTHRVVLLAEARIGAELRAAQGRGEVATKEAGRPVSVQSPDTSALTTLRDLGIPRQRAAEYKALADAGEEKITAAVKAAVDEGRVPSRSSVLCSIRPAAAEAARQVTAYISRPRIAPPPPVPGPIVQGAGPDWVDWTGAVQVLATLDADPAALARAFPDLRDTLAVEAQAAIPRLRTWLDALEALDV